MAGLDLSPLARAWRSLDSAHAETFCAKIALEEAVRLNLDPDRTETARAALLRASEGLQRLKEAMDQLVEEP